MDAKQLPEVCVVMPVYNGSRTIDSAIKSLLCQTYTNWHCVIVNDGSTDDTKDMLDKINDIRFKIIHLEKNKGRGFARQVCLENATGDFLAYLDADDFYNPSKLEKQVSVMLKYRNVHLVATAIGSFDFDLNLRIVRGLKFQGIQKVFNSEDLKFTPGTVMLRLSSVGNLKYNYSLNASEDVNFLSLYLINKDYYIVNEVLYYYSEFESTSYFKTIEYSFNSFKRIVFSRRQMKHRLFLKELIVVSYKIVFYVLFYHLLGKKYFIKRRGIKPTVEHIAEFENVVNNLQSTTI